MTKSEQKPTIRDLTKQAKIPVAAMIGAVIGSGGTLFTYYSALGGAERLEQISQIEATVEHNRRVSEETLALFKKIEAQVAEQATHSDAVLSKKPTQRELDDAIDGLFEGLDEGAPEQTGKPGEGKGPAVDSAPESAQQSASAEPVSEAGSGSGSGSGSAEKPASNEVAGK